ncbi:biotin-dependent carboxyltransferase family protein [Vibrio europaeus]|uniref:5-oxoprolinase subunit C family protein n=1 Tax=Vibrio europaeus TaxID=300876 RepID=UPI00233E81F6|nr:biotin-dependent carboxyltransferase family protein [Vibrio europaeus]MDC5718937.1 biotin-dependent carboxyltransferase family protein [Vibrio europaeus]MDC5756104.1 biotin-dependent carboxyltransferase family protein [Vibrio europaeus]MDC5774645.1 biotin-dependent carboxyltransferase family protein [Vibrio europaeus]MDC5793783.1 biotin-dependent carboxyltransferase family protein [Vibrio europaeus]MDC5800054.1 biotin-dependent carboxyltransferase family protein [Vibrio europaeus]
MTIENYIEVVKPGQQTLIQDFGRFGLAHFGIAQGGPVDDYAYSWANHLLGNSINMPTLEITLGQAEFLIHHSCELAIAGGDLNAKLDGVSVDNWSTFRALKGQTLTFALPHNGLRAYLAIKGGFNIPTQLGSASTVERDQLGGLTHGTPLQSGDVLPFDQHAISSSSVQMTFRYKPDYNLPLELRVIEGYQVNDFSRDAVNSLYTQQFEVSQLVNRMGYRLSGSKVNAPNKEYLSEGIALGSIQVTPSGEPIVLLNDRQTIGGYPKIGCVARIDLPRLAQAKPGQKVKFVRGDLLGLQDVWGQWARFFGY